MSVLATVWTLQVAATRIAVNVPDLEWAGKTVQIATAAVPVCRVRKILVMLRITVAAAQLVAEVSCIIAQLPDYPMNVQELNDE